MNEETQNKDSKEQNDNKVEKKFRATMDKLTAIVSGPKNLLPSKKIPKDSVSDLVEELFKEDREAKLVEVKNGLKALLKSYAEMQSAFRAKNKELADLELKKKDEFVKAANSLFNQIENVDQIEKSYREGINTLTEKGKDEEVEEETEEKSE